MVGLLLIYTFTDSNSKPAEGTLPLKVGLQLVRTSSSDDGSTMVGADLY